MNQKNFALDPETGMLTETDAKRYFSRLGFAAAALVSLYFLSNLALVLLVYRFVPHWLENPLIYQALSLIPLYGIAVPCFLAILSKLPKAPALTDTLGVKGMLGMICVSFTLMLAGNSIGNTLITLFQMLSGTALENPVAELTVGRSWWVNLIFMGIIPPILEELVFRKFLCDRLLPLGEGYAVVLSAVIFGLAHGNFFQFFYAFLLGLLFALIYVKTGKLRYSMTCHALINIVGGVVAPLMLEKLIPKLTPMREQEFIDRMFELAKAEDFDGWFALMTPFVTPMLILMAYSFFLYALAIVGLVILFVYMNKIRLQKGILPPPQKGRLANIFCNVGVAVAVTVYTAIFVLSLFG